VEWRCDIGNFLDANCAYLEANVCLLSWKPVLGLTSIVVSVIACEAVGERITVIGILGGWISLQVNDLDVQLGVFTNVCEVTSSFWASVDTDWTLKELGLWNRRDCCIQMQNDSVWIIFLGSLVINDNHHCFGLHTVLWILILQHHFAGSSASPLFFLTSV
jgi:hypothetical protein